MYLINKKYSAGWLVTYSIQLLAVACTLITMESNVHAQAYPERAVKVIVPYAPGGGSDTVARAISHRLSEK